jgi:hypothetical protein
VSGTCAVDYDKCAWNYFLCGEEILRALKDNIDEKLASFPVREEFRITLNLFNAIYRKWEERRRPQLGSRQLRVFPFIAHPTERVLRFAYDNVCRLARAYEAVITSRPLGALNKNQEQLVYLLGTLLQTSFTSIEWRRYPALRPKLIAYDKVIKRWGIFWLNSFLLSKSNRPTIPNRLYERLEPLSTVISSHYPSNPRVHWHRQGFRSEIAIVMEELGTLEESSIVTGQHIVLCRWLAFMVVVEYIRETWEKLYSSSLFKFKAKERWCEAQQIPMKSKHFLLKLTLV